MSKKYIAVRLYAGYTKGGQSKHCYAVFNENNVKIDVLLTDRESEVTVKYPDIKILMHIFEINAKEWKFLKGYKSQR